jgi:soluble lytic murein transglycosylase
MEHKGHEGKLRFMKVPTFVSIVSFVLIQLWALPARAELVFFTSGRTLSVKAHRADGDLMVLALRSGGEMTCDASLIARVGPDEVPYPEPEEASATVRLKPDTTDASHPNSTGSVRLQPDAAYAAIIDKVAAEQGVDAKLVRAVIQVESAYQPRARSSKGAMGLMQLMPATARQYAVADPYDPVANIEAGIKHLKTLLERFPVALALAAYNAGEAAVQRFRGIPPYPETRSYVTRILQLASS